MELTVLDAESEFKVGDIVLTLKNDIFLPEDRLGEIMIIHNNGTMLLKFFNYYPNSKYVATRDCLKKVDPKAGKILYG